MIKPMCLRQAGGGGPQESSSTSNFSVAFGGITLPAPESPYPYSGAQVRTARSPVLSTNTALNELNAQMETRDRTTYLFSY